MLISELFQKYVVGYYSYYILFLDMNIIIGILIKYARPRYSGKSFQLLLPKISGSSSVAGQNQNLVPFGFG